MKDLYHSKSTLTLVGPLEELTWESLLDLGDFIKFVLDLCEKNGRPVSLIQEYPDYDRPHLITLPLSPTK